MLGQGLCRARIQKFLSESPCYRVRLERTDDRVLARSVGVEALLRSVRQNSVTFANLTPGTFVGAVPTDAQAVAGKVMDLFNKKANKK